MEDQTQDQISSEVATTDAYQEYFMTEESDNKFVTNGSEEEENLCESDCGSSSTSNSDQDDYLRFCQEEEDISDPFEVTDTSSSSQAVKDQLHSLVLSRSFGKDSPSIPLHMLPHQRRKLSSVDYHMDESSHDLPFSSYHEDSNLKFSEVNHNIPSMPEVPNSQQTCEKPDSNKSLHCNFQN